MTRETIGPSVTYSTNVRVHISYSRPLATKFSRRPYGVVGIDRSYWEIESNCEERMNEREGRE